MNPFNFYKYLPFFLRRKFNEKFIIIESDDWGLERALTDESLDWVKEKFGEDKFSRWTRDSLETSEDLDLLFDLLERYQTKFEYPPVITANFITHNVDHSSKDKLNFIPICDGFNASSEDVRLLYKKGFENKYIFPQLHGYSHYNIDKVEKYFSSEEGMEALSKNFFEARSTIKGNLAFLQGELSEKNSQAGKIKEASEVFNKLFGFIPKTIIPPTFIFDIQLAKMLKDNKISLIQSSNRLVGSDNKRYYFPYFHKRKNLYWSIRNARLDPHTDYKFYHEQCVNSIEKAFESKSPAVIDFHRVNFAGKYAPAYRDRTLEELKLLLDKVCKKWPDAKFIHTQKLNDILWQQETK